MRACGHPYERNSQNQAERVHALNEPITGCHFRCGTTRITHHAFLTWRMVLTPGISDEPFVALALETNRGTVPRFELDDFPLLVAAHESRGRTQQVVDVAAHHDVAARRSDFRHERGNRIAGIDRVSCLRGFGAQLRGDAFGGIDGPLLVAVQDAYRRDTERSKARTEPVGLFFSFCTDMSLRILLGRQRVDMMHEIDFHAPLRSFSLSQVTGSTGCRSYLPTPCTSRNRHGRSPCGVTL